MEVIIAVIIVFTILLIIQSNVLRKRAVKKAREAYLRGVDEAMRSMKELNTNSFLNRNFEKWSKR